MGGVEVCVLNLRLAAAQVASGWEADGTEATGRPAHGRNGRGGARSATGAGPNFFRRELADQVGKPRNSRPSIVYF